MAHQMTLTLTDEEYAKLAAQAAQNDTSIESLARDILSRSLIAPAHTSYPDSASQFTQRQYQEGKILNLPTRAPLTTEDVANREQRARLLSGGKSAAEMVSEDRGPR